MKAYNFSQLIKSIFGVVALALILVGPASATTSNDSDNSVSSVVTAVAMKEVHEIVEENFKASERENGVFNKITRGTTGISIKDIKEYGPLGGPNSEARKVLRIFGL